MLFVWYWVAWYASEIDGLDGGAYSVMEMEDRNSGPSGCCWMIPPIGWEVE